MRSVGVILTGCGFYDGSDIWESVLLSYLLEKKGLKVIFLSFDIFQKEVINHFRRDNQIEKRNILIESARIAKGEVSHVKDFPSDRIGALFLPGGLGVLNNISTWDEETGILKVEQQLRRLIRETFRRKKPLGVCGLSSILIANCLQGMTNSPLSLTIGNDPVWVKRLENLGVNHVIARGTEAVIDRQNKVVSTPAGQLEGRISGVYTGVENLVSGVLELEESTFR